MDQVEDEFTKICFYEHRWHGLVCFLYSCKLATYVLSNQVHLLPINGLKIKRGCIGDTNGIDRSLELNRKVKCKTKKPIRYQRNKIKIKLTTDIIVIHCFDLTFSIRRWCYESFWCLPICWQALQCRCWRKHFTFW